MPSGRLLFTTVTVQLAETFVPRALAVMVTVPRALAVTTPLELTVAIFRLLLVQVTRWLAPSGSTVAESVSRLPTAMSITALD